MSSEAGILELYAPTSPALDVVLVYAPWFRELAGEFLDRRPLPWNTLADVRDEAASTARSVYLIGPGEYLDPFCLMRLRQRLPGALGVQVARDPAEARETLSRRAHNARRTGLKDVLIDRTQQGPAHHAGHLEMYHEDTFKEASDTIGVLQRPLRLLAITAHGRDDIVYLPQVVLCGKNALVQPSRGTRLPACTQTGDCLYRGRPVFSPAQLQVGVAFLNTCRSFVGEQGLFQAGYAMDWAFRLNAHLSHYVASPAIHHGEGSQAHLLSRLLDTGMPIGQAVNIVDDLMSFWNREGRCFLIDGDPCTRWPVRDRPLPIAQPGPDQVTVHDRTFIALLPGECLPGHHLEVIGLPHVQALPSRNGYYLLSREGLEPGTYQTRTHDLGAITSAVQTTLVSTLRQLRHLGILGIHAQKLAGQTNDLENRLKHLRKWLAIFHSTHRFQDITAKLAKNDQIVQGIDATVMAETLDVSARSAFHISEIYRAECELKSVVSVGRPCPHCHDPTAEALWQHSLFSDFQRTARQCFRCGYVSDEPADAPLGGTLTTPTAAEVGTAFRATLQLDRGVPAGTRVACCVLDTQRYCGQAVQQIVVASEEQTTFEFTMQVPADLPTHHFWVRAYAVRCAQVHFWGANLWITAADTRSDSSSPQPA